MRPLILMLKRKEKDVLFKLDIEQEHNLNWDFLLHVMQKLSLLRSGWIG